MNIIKHRPACTAEELAASAPQMYELLHAAWDAYAADPSPAALEVTMIAIEELLWRLDGND